MPAAEKRAGSPAWARACWSAAEPFIVSRSTAPEVVAACEAAGVPGLAAILVVRAAPMGPAAPASIGAVMHGLPARSISKLFPAVWSTGSAGELVAATHRSVQTTSAGRFADLTDRAGVVSELLSAALADLDTAGRPLAAASAAVPLPAEVWARLWRQLTTLREHRGDGHIAALTAAALDPAQAQVLMVGWAAGHVAVDFLRSSRRLDDATWAAAVAGLADRGLAAADGSLTAAGREFRSAIEDSTDEAAAGPYRKLGGSVQEVFDLCREMSRRVVEDEGFPAVTPVGAPWPPVAPVAAA